MSCTDSPTMRPDDCPKPAEHGTVTKLFSSRVIFLSFVFDTCSNLNISLQRGKQSLSSKMENIQTIFLYMKRCQ